jgi:hypothetical protein
LGLLTDDGSLTLNIDAEFAQTLSELFGKSGNGNAHGVRTAVGFVGIKSYPARIGAPPYF